MRDIASNLKERFDYASHSYLSTWSRSRQLILQRMPVPMHTAGLQRVSACGLLCKPCLLCVYSRPVTLSIIDVVS